MGYAGQGLSEQRRHAGEQPRRVIAVEPVEADSREVHEPNAGVVTADLNELHSLDRVELRVGAYDVSIDEPGRAERTQSRLEPIRDRQLEGRLTHSPHHTWI